MGKQPPNERERAVGDATGRWRGPRARGRGPRGARGEGRGVRARASARTRGPRRVGEKAPRRFGALSASGGPKAEKLTRTTFGDRRFDPGRRGSRSSNCRVTPRLFGVIRHPSAPRRLRAHTAPPRTAPRHERERTRAPERPRRRSARPAARAARARARGERVGRAWCYPPRERKSRFFRGFAGKPSATRARPGAPPLRAYLAECAGEPPSARAPPRAPAARDPARPPPAPLAPPRPSPPPPDPRPPCRARSPSC